MKLTLEGIKALNYKEKGYILPQYDINKVKEETLKKPTWVHFGAGNIFRAYMAKLQQRLLNENLVNTGIIIAEGYDYEIIDKVFTPHDNLTLSVELRSDGSIKKEVIASMTHAFRCDTLFKEDFLQLVKVFENPTLQMVSFTITEKGYDLKNAQNEFYQTVLEDFKGGFLDPKSYLGKVVYLLYKRYLANKAPLTLVSMDNMTHNGDKLKASILHIAKEWVNTGNVEADFYSYLNTFVSYPWSMIDKITPRPDELVASMLSQDGFLDNQALVTSKNTYVAPYVNAEETEYFVVEDNFKNGKLPLDKVGIIYTDKETVDKVERMKVCTCLNPLHTVLAIYGCLLGYTKISDQMKDEVLVKMVKTIGYDEGLKVVTDPEIIDPKEFIDTVINTRLPNPFMPDSPQRIATDTSQKLSIRFGQTIRAYAKNPGLDVLDLKVIPLVHAGWLRYLMAIDDEGNDFTLSPDPLLEQVRSFVANIKLGDKITLKSVKNLLENERIFGVNLIEVNLGQIIVNYFNELNEGPKAIRNTLKKHLVTLQGNLKYT